MKSRFTVRDATGHTCCYLAEVIDTHIVDAYGEAFMCACFTHGDAQKIAAALNSQDQG